MALFSRRQAIAVTDAHFHGDVDNLIHSIEKAIGARDVSASNPAAAVAGDAARNEPSVVDARSAARSVSVIFIGAIALSFATWWYFYKMSMPLDAGATIVVVGAWIVVVMIIRWIWAGLARGRARAGGQK